METIKQSTKALSKAVSVLKKGGVIICPTDTVYGFLAEASNKKSVNRIFKIKKRPKSKPLPIFVKDFNMAKELAFIDDNQAKILKKFWPGKYTFVLKRKPNIKLYGVAKNIPTAKPSRILDKVGTIALRIPKYKFLNNLLKKVNKPLVQTSVNISGGNALVKIGDIIKKFDTSDILIIDGGDIKKGKSSKILDLNKDKIKILRK